MDAHKSELSLDYKLRRIAKRKEVFKKKQERKRRIIIRNLSFKINENKLKKILTEYGNVVEVTIPRKPDGKMRGFAFAQYENFQSAVQAIKNLNYKEILGRPVAIDYAIAKDKFENANTSNVENSSTKNSSDDSDPEIDKNKKEDIDEESGDSSENENDDDNNKNEDNHVDKFLKEFEFDSNSDRESGENLNNESSSDEEEDNDDDGVESESEKPVKEFKKEVSSDTQEGRTVFIRNISFNTDQESFKEAMEEFGSVTYCLLCIDPNTELPKGTAFVKFENKEDADKLIKKASDEFGTGVYFDHRKLYCVPAISRDDLKEKLSSSDNKGKKDKRNLYLLREGLIMQNSEEAEGVSPSDLAKRIKLEAVKKQKLKNLNFFVSETRLCVHNLPLNYTDQQLRHLFRTSAPKNSVIREARIIRELNKVASSGEAKSKGFGFVTFSRHEDALEALRKVNNNSSVFSHQKRPIVEFAIENHLALLSKQRNRERHKQKLKKKEENMEKPEVKKPIISTFRNKKKKTSEVQKATKKSFGAQKFTSPDTQNTKKTKNKKFKKKKNEGKADVKHLKSLMDQYKNKLLNKYK